MKVLEKRDVDGDFAIRRRRECLDCGFRFTTYERIEAPMLVVIKKDGRKEVYSRDKMSVGIYKAMEKRPAEQSVIEGFIDEVEKQLKAAADGEVNSSHIGELILTNLRKLDEVAYVRFASVYKDFDNIDSFSNELESLKQK